MRYYKSASGIFGLNTGHGRLTARRHAAHREGHGQMAPLCYFGPMQTTHPTPSVIRLCPGVPSPVACAIPMAADFGTSDLAQRIRTAGMALST